MLVAGSCVCVWRVVCGVPERSLGETRAVAPVALAVPKINLAS